MTRKRSNDNVRILSVLLHFRFFGSKITQRHKYIHTFCRLLKKTGLFWHIEPFFDSANNIDTESDQKKIVSIFSLRDQVVWKYFETADRSKGKIYNEIAKGPGEKEKEHEFYKF